MVSSSTSISASYLTKRSRSTDPSPQKKITLKVKSQQDGREDIYKISVKAQIKKLMVAYCKKRNLELKTIRFLFDSKELKPKQTPSQLEMEDDDVIDVVSEQGGGGPYAAV